MNALVPIFLVVLVALSVFVGFLLHSRDRFVYIPALCLCILALSVGIVGSAIISADTASTIYERAATQGIFVHVDAWRQIYTMNPCRLKLELSDDEKSLVISNLEQKATPTTLALACKGVGDQAPPVLHVP